MTILTKLIETLKEAESAATMVNFGCAFPNESITITDVHFPADGYNVGTRHHPTAYVVEKTRIYRETWILPRIREAIAILETHEQLLVECEKLAKAVNSIDIGRLQHLANAGMGLKP